MSQFDGRVGKLRLARKVVETLGWRWAITRIYLEAEHRSGVLERRTPLTTWTSHELRGGSSVRFVGLHTGAAGRFLASQPEEVADALGLHLETLKGREFDIFGTPYQLHSWHEEPITPASYPPDQHWSRVRELPEADLKLVWEASRFTWAFDLARLHALDDSTAAPEVFWTLFEDWCQANQPNAGVNWKCGQESAVRLLSVMFAVQAFGETSLTPARRTLLAKFADVTARRIKSHWRYARSQDNNHIVSEAVGLITVSLLFPRLAIATEARALGERLLSEACDKLVFPDGGTSQYSLNYHRVFMENFIWALRLYRSSDEEPPPELIAALDRTYRFLLAITQKSDGAAGNWGNNDGAHLLPLASTRHLDVRPTLMMAAQILEGAPHSWGGPAEEAAWWLGGEPEHYLDPDPEPEGVQTKIFPYAGISIMVNGRHRALIRGGEHQLFRPPQCDFGHVELWVDGEQVVFDPGTWSYKPKPGEPDLSETQWHNMPHPPGEQQMTRLGRFLWGDWPQVNIEAMPMAGGHGLSVQVTTRASELVRHISTNDSGWQICDSSGSLMMPPSLRLRASVPPTGYSPRP